VRQFGNHTDITLAPPFAVGDDVETGGFLQRDGGTNGAAHQPVIFVVRKGVIVGDQFANEHRPRERTDHRGGKQRVGHIHSLCRCLS
jgi:hypothetical protein